MALQPGRHKRAEGGHPWIYSNEIQMNEAAKSLPPGSLVTLRAAGGQPIGVATFNPHTLVSARLLDRHWDRKIDASFLKSRLEAALTIRNRLYPDPFYRLVHAEADGLPGLVIDRFGEIIVCQLNTAGLMLLEAELIEALESLLHQKTIVLRNDSPARGLEGLEPETRVVRGALDSPIELIENGAVLFADLAGGQKTGWFYDQRDNRRFVKDLARDARVLDLYSFAGGFAVEAALGGAREVLAIDRSEAALALASKAAERNGVADHCRFLRADVFDELQRMAGLGERFDIVVADPPAFIKSRKDLGPGLRGYRKLARMSAAVVAKGGYLLAASCSHNASPEDFAEAVRRGVQDAGRTGRILRQAGAAPDHPVHPFLPESAYLKAEVLALD